MLTRYWITFEERGDLPFLGGAFAYGVGVTAYDIEDAKSLIRKKVFKGYRMPAIKKIVENVAFDALEKNHVQPNMGTIVLRGVWFPKGFE